MIDLSCFPILAMLLSPKSETRPCSSSPGCLDDEVLFLVIAGEVSAALLVGIIWFNLMLLAGGFFNLNKAFGGVVCLFLSVVGSFVLVGCL